MYKTDALCQISPPFSPSDQMSNASMVNATIPSIIYYGYYGYDPSLWISATFSSLFALSTVLHGFEALYYNKKICLITVFLCGLTESIGWAGRLWSHFDLLDRHPYLMQMVSTILAPTFMVALLFLTLGEIIRRLGLCYSRLQPKTYTITFVIVDFCSLVIQAIGGALAANASEPTEATTGANIMLGGISLQLVGITAYSVFATDFGIRCYLDKPFRQYNSELFGWTHSLDRNMIQMISTMVFTTVVLYIRAVYRIVELSGGWDGVIINTERYFVIYDGLMVLFAIWSFVFFHPGRLLMHDGTNLASPTAGLCSRSGEPDEYPVELFRSNSLHSKDVPTPTTLEDMNLDYSAKRVKKTRPKFCA